MKLIKFTLLVCVALFFTKNVNAQNSNYSFGLRAGANYSNIYGDPETLNREGNVGVTFGAFSRIGGKLYVEPSVYYSLYSSKFEMNNQKHEVKFGTLQIPVLIGYKFFERSDLNLHVGVGPEANLNLKKPDAVQGNEYKSFDPRARFNLGVDLKNVTFDLASSYGLGKINKSLDQRIGMYSLTVGFKF